MNAPILPEKPFFNLKPPSPEEAERRTASEKQMLENQRKMKIEELLNGADLPKRHRLLSSPVTDHPWGVALALIRSKIQSGAGPIIGICGERGNGKTQLGVEAARGLIGELKPAFYTKATTFLTRVRSAYNDKAETEQDIIAELRAFKLLVIDEIGKRSDSQWENNLLFALIDSRYDDVKSTILIDNRNKDDFLATIGPSLSSRMQETGGIIEATWESFRK